MIRRLDVDAVLTELGDLAREADPVATVAVLACMDVVERHGRIADEAVEPLLQQHPVERPRAQPGPTPGDRGGRTFRRGSS